MYAQLDNITKREQFRNVAEYLNLFDLHAQRYFKEWEIESIFEMKSMDF